MPLFYQQNINATTRLAIWKIEESEAFFASTVPLQREITHPHKRLQHLAGRFLLRYLFPAFPYQEILIANTRKPFLQNEAYHFSISHCGDYAAAIVSTNQRVGIDIEVPKEKVMRIVGKFLSEEERKIFNIQQLTTKYQLPTLLWSAKEAIFKWWGNGEVDFSEMIRLQKFDFEGEGKFEATSLPTHSVTIPLIISYKIFDGLCLAFTSTTIPQTNV
jgi:phosphopantetheinyl transferase